MSLSTLRTSIAGIRFANPVWVGSSELTMSVDGIARVTAAGAGAVVAKSVNESPAARRQLGIAEYAALGSGWEQRAPGEAQGDSAFLNRSGLADVDRDTWLAVLREGRIVAEAGDAVLIGSVVVGDPTMVPELVRDIGGVTEHVEVNIGAPHGREVRSGAVQQVTASDDVRRLVERAREECPGLLLIKLGDVGPLLGEVMDAAVAGGADAVVLNGRQSGFLPDLDTLDPVLGSWGAYSAPASLPMSLYAVSKGYQRHPEVPLVGTNGARSGDDVLRFVLSGASAAEVVTSVWLEGPAAITRIIAELQVRLARSPLTSVSEGVGVSVGRAHEYADIEPLDTRPWDAWGREGDAGKA